MLRFWYNQFMKLSLAVSKFINADIEYNLAKIKDKDIPVPEFEIKVKDKKEKDDKLDIKKINKLLEDPKMVELLKALTKNL